MKRRILEPEAVRQAEPPRKRAKHIDTSVEAEEPDKEEHLPSGEILTDITQRTWRLGKPIGKGSFGEIYLASDDVSKEATLDNSRYAIKIEPHNSGPLFVEIHCLIRTARHDMLKNWQETKKKPSFGMPHYIASGSHVCNGVKYRFLVLPRYESDLQKIASNLTYYRIQPRNVLILAAQIIDVLEYLHNQGYAHSDIKSSNLMVGFDRAAFKNNTQKKLVTKQKQNAEPPKTKVVKSKKSKEPKLQGYYADEDFDLHNYSSGDSEIEISDSKKRLLRFPKNKKNRPKNQRGRGIFNLRKVNQSINYEDVNSSICSDESYQSVIISKAREKSSAYSSDEGFHEETSDNKCSDEEFDDFEEAVASQNNGQIYLLDYGLASKFLNSDGTHKEFGMDLRKAHDGTLEYSSRDSHIGAHSRRSDLENLGYNLLDWLTGGLPWKTPEILADPDLIHAIKKNYMKDIKKLLETCFKSPLYPKFLEDYFLYVTELDFKDKPDYEYCRNLFVNEFVRCGYGSEKDMVLNFKNDLTTKMKQFNKSKRVKQNFNLNYSKSCEKPKLVDVENLICNSWENDVKKDLLKEIINSSNDGIRKPCASRNYYVSDAALISKLRQSLLPNMETPSKKFSPKVLRSKKIVKKKKKGTRSKKSNIGKFGNFLGSCKQYTWAEILAGNPESLMRKVDKEKASNVDTTNDTLFLKKPRSRKVSNASEVSVIAEVNISSNLLNKDFLSKLNPTHAMKEVVANYKKKAQGKPKPETHEAEPNVLRYTPAMFKVLAAKEKRIKKEKALEAKLIAQQKKLQKLEPKASTAPRGRSSNKKVVKVSTTPQPVRNGRKKTENVVITPDDNEKTNKTKKLAKPAKTARRGQVADVVEIKTPKTNRKNGNKKTSKPVQKSVPTRSLRSSKAL